MIRLTSLVVKRVLWVFFKFAFLFSFFLFIIMIKKIKTETVLRWLWVMSSEWSWWSFLSEVWYHCEPHYCSRRDPSEAFTSTDELLSWLVFQAAPLWTLSLANNLFCVLSFLKAGRLSGGKVIQQQQDLSSLTTTYGDLRQRSRHLCRKTPLSKVKSCLHAVLYPFGSPISLAGSRFPFL